jgi:DNA-binding LacI/PurR family transcriptional regulator
MVEEVLNEYGADGIVCKADQFAAEVGRHLHAMGVEIGRDVLLAGFDDDPVAALLPISLTTVRLDARAFARAALHCVEARLAKTMPQEVQVLIDCEVVIRGSTRGGS